MATLAPPVMTGPILTTSPSVRVEGILAGASVRVRSTDGMRHAEGVASSNGVLWLTVTTPFQAGTTIVASQKRGADSSALTVHGIEVQVPPDVLPRPVFDSMLNQCSDAVLLSGLVPGATVTVKDGPTVLGTPTADRTPQWLPLSASLTVGSVLSAFQSLPGVPDSPVGLSTPIFRIDPEAHFGPFVDGPLTACQSQINFSGAVPGTIVVAEFDDGSSNSWHAPDATFAAKVSSPLREGIVTTRQDLPRCRITGDRIEWPVGPEVKPAAPHPQDFCPESQRILVDGLVTGATVTFVLVEWTNGAPNVLGDLMIAGASGGQQSFDLPIVIGGSGDLKQLHITQSLCTTTSPVGIANEWPRPGAGAGGRLPLLHEPVYSCSQVVLIEPPGWGLGTLRSARTGAQLADVFVPGPYRQLISPWFPLVEGDEIVVEYEGCGGPKATNVARVQAVPNPMPDVKFETPLPEDTDLRVSDAFIGARLFAVVNQVIVSSRIAVDGTATLPVGGLRKDDKVWVFQRLCGASGNSENFVEVRKGNLTASITPASTLSKKIGRFEVTATRVDTGAVIDDLNTSLGGTPVGWTGHEFQIFINAGQPILAGIVEGGLKYNNASFALAVQDPPPPPPVPPPVTSTALTLKIGAPIFGVVVSDVKWRIVCAWPGGPTLSGTGSTATITVAAAPAGTVDPHVQVYLDQIVIAKDGVALAIDRLSPLTNVGLTKAALIAGFLVTLDTRPAYDDDGDLVGFVVVAVLRWQGTS